MPQRVFLCVIESPATKALAELEAAARCGALSNSKDWFHPQTLEVLAASGRVACLFGIEAGFVWPPRLKGFSVHAFGGEWQVLPPTLAGRANRALAGLPAPAEGERLFEAAARIANQEPWDLFVARIAGASDGKRLAERLKSFSQSLAPDVLIIIAWNPPTGPGRWLSRSRGQPPGELPEASAQDLLPTALCVLGVTVPPGFPGRALDVRCASSAPAGYTAQDEKEIQKRLEDLGYV